MVRQSALPVFCFFLFGAAAASAVEIRADFPVLGQVRDGYLSGETEAPMEIYGNLGLSRLRHGTTLDTYFRLEEDFARLNGQADFYSGVLRVPNAVPWMDAQLGRQIVAEAPANIFDADSGQLRFALGGPFWLTAYGGAPRYFEPSSGMPGLTDDEQIFGATLRGLPVGGGAYSLGFMQQIQAGREIKQLVTASASRSFARAPGVPSVYANFAYDADRQNIDLARLGWQSFVLRPELLFNLEGGYYKPQDNGKRVIQDLNRREDTVFQVFSVSQMLQARTGLRYAFTPTVSVYGDFAYQGYDQLSDSSVNGFIWSAGTLYLPGGDGLESVSAWYYGVDSAGGTVNGVHAFYENRVYERVLFRANCDIAYYDKSTNQSDTVLGSLLGLDYVLLPGLVAEVNFEANRNQLQPEDFRFGFFIIYNTRYQTDGGGLQRGYAASGGQRPWAWGLPEFGPAAWGAAPAGWTTTPSLPGSWAGSQAVAAANPAYAAPRGASAGDNPANWVPQGEADAAPSQESGK